MGSMVGFSAVMPITPKNDVIIRKYDNIVIIVILCLVKQGLHWSAVPALVLYAAALTAPEQTAPWEV